MPRAGALKNVYVVNDDGLRTAGGRWLLQGGPAIKVRGFRSDNLGDRRVVHGGTVPVYVLQEADLRPNGGRFRLMSGQSMKVSDVIGLARGVQQGTAIPVFPVDDNGNFDKLWGSYAAKILATEPNNLIGYWIMDEAAGAVAVDYSPENNDGAYTGVTLGQPGIGDGLTSPFFDGTNDFNNILSAGLTADFDGDELSLVIWAKLDDPSIWTDGSAPRIIRLGSTAGSNDATIWKSVVNNRIQFETTRTGGGFQALPINIDGLTSADWIVYAITFSQSAGEFKAFVNGSQVGATQNPTSTWLGNLNTAIIGALTLGPVTPWDGFLAHCALWTTQLTDAQIADLAVIP